MKSILYLKKSKIINSIISFLFISGIVYILDVKLNILSIINSATLKNIENSLEVREEKYINNTDSVVLLISNIMFEKEFNSHTPLNKSQLKILIQTISNQKPKSIIFDLDISPDYNFLKKDFNYEEDYLYDLIINIAKDINIVLPFAFISETNENKLLKSKWATKLCKNNINFGIPNISTEIGALIKFYNYSNHISLYSQRKDEHSICKKILDNNSVDLMEIKLDENKKYHNSKQLPINYHKINSNTIILNTMKDIVNYDLKNKVIFLGGGYGFGDTFITPYGEKFGIQILDTIYLSQMHTINNANIYIATFIDIFIGLLFGIIFSYLIECRRKTLTNNGIVFNNIFLISILIGFIWISTIISTYLFHNLYIWLNPIPIIIGMFIDMLINMERKKITSKKIYDSLLQLIIRFTFVIIGIVSLIPN